jgi:hypothetical protein
MSSLGKKRSVMQFEIFGILISAFLRSDFLLVEHFGGSEIEIIKAGQDRCFKAVVIPPTGDIVT